MVNATPWPGVVIVIKSVLMECEVPDHKLTGQTYNCDYWRCYDDKQTVPEYRH